MRETEQWKCCRKPALDVGRELATGKMDAVGICGKSGFRDRVGHEVWLKGERENKRQGGCTFPSFPYQDIGGMDDSSHKSKEDSFFKDQYHILSRCWADPAEQGTWPQGSRGTTTEAMLPWWERGMGSRPRAQPPTGDSSRPSLEGRQSGCIGKDAGGHVSTWRVLWRLEE